MSTLVKNLRLKSRIFTDHADVRAMDVFGSNLLILHPNDVSFTGIIDNMISQVYCEGSFTGEFEFAQFQLERHRHQQSYIYGLTTSNEIIIFDYKYAGSNNDNNFCRLVGRVAIPEQFTNGMPVGFAAIRGSIILQNATGKLLLIDTTNESILQEAHLYFYSPYGQGDNDD